MPLGGTLRAILPLPSYVGPGDVVTNAIAWWGLRAYRAASIGSNAIRLRRDSDNSEQDFVTLIGGGLDLVSIATFKGAANLLVSKLYDQTGNGLNMVQATAANQPPFLLNVLGSFPMIVTALNSQWLNTAAGITQAQPFTVSHVESCTSSATQTVILGDGTSFSTGFGTSLNTAYVFGGTVLTAAETDGTFYAYQDVLNGASSDVNQNGTSNTGNAGTTGIVNTNPLELFGYAAGSFDTNVKFGELGIWAGAFSSGQSTSMSANQRAYWGF